MQTRNETRNNARRRTGWLAITIGLAGPFGLLAILAGCQPLLLSIAEGITGIPLAGFSTPTQIPTPSPVVTPSVGTPTPGAVQVKFVTSLGVFVVQLNNLAPITVQNFLQYVDAGSYNDTIFHRSVQSSIFIVQGGGFFADCTSRSTFPPIPLEDNTGLTNVRGTIAMARTSVYDSATSQFFINNQNNPGLDRTSTQRGYAVFGTVISGMDVVDAIAALPIKDASSICSVFSSKPCPAGDIYSSVLVFSASRQ